MAAKGTIIILHYCAKSWFLGHLLLWLFRLLKKSIGRTWASFLLPLDRAAQAAGKTDYKLLVYASTATTHSSTLNGEFIGSGYFGFSFHFAFVSGLLFPDFLNKAIDNPGLFYLTELTSSAVIAAVITILMVAGHMGMMAFVGYKTNNLSEHVEARWDKAFQSGGMKRIGFILAMLRLPFSGFPGVIKKGMTFCLDGESPLEVSAAGPMLWDRRVAFIGWVLSVPMVAFLVIAPRESVAVLPTIFEWITRMTIPLAIVATMGTFITGKGAYTSYVVEKALTGKKDGLVGHRFDLHELKESFFEG